MIYSYLEEVYGVQTSVSMLRKGEVDSFIFYSLTLQHYLVRGNFPELAEVKLMSSHPPVLRG
jgi:hypothetical protein